MENSNDVFGKIFLESELKNGNLHWDLDRIYDRDTLQEVSRWDNIVLGDDEISISVGDSWYEYSTLEDRDNDYNILKQLLTGENFKFVN